MSTYEFFEYGLLLIILILQVFAFKYAYRVITVLKGSVPVSKKYWAGSSASDQATKVADDDALPELTEIYSSPWESDTIPYATSPSTQLKSHPSISTVDSNEVFQQICHEINNYLSLSTHTTADFGVMRDITNRHTESEEQNANLLLPIPLYLGLMGTMLGIVIGLFSMGSLGDLDSTTSGDLLGSSINTLLGGVKIAMCGSFTGLLLTILATHYFRIAKNELDKSKGLFYIFLQTEIVPQFKSNMQNTFSGLEASLLKFGEGFNTSIAALGTVVDKNYKAVLKQQQILDKEKELLEVIKEIDVKKVAAMNNKTFQGLQEVMSQFDRFNQHFAQLNEIHDKSRELINKLIEIAARTENFDNIATDINKQLSESKMLMDFLKSHFHDLEARKMTIDGAVVKMDEYLQKSMVTLRDHLDTTVQKNIDFQIGASSKITEIIVEANTNNMHGFGKLNNLDKLQEIAKNLAIWESNAQSQNKAFRKEIAELKSEMSGTKEVLEKMLANNLGYVIRNWFKRIFSTKGSPQDPKDSLPPPIPPSSSKNPKS